MRYERQVHKSTKHTNQVTNRVARIGKSYLGVQSEQEECRQPNKGTFMSESCAEECALHNMNAFPEDIWTYVKCLSFHNISLVMLPFMTTVQLYNTKCFALTCLSFNPWEGNIPLHIFRSSQIFIFSELVNYSYL